MVKILLFSEQQLFDFSRELLVAAGVPGEHAVLVADCVVTSSVRGVDSHGIALLPSYVAQIQAGGVNPGSVGKVLHESGPCLLYDGEDGLGHVVSDRCAQHAIRLAGQFGLALIVARNSDHFGAAAFWGEKLSRAGFIGIVMTNGGPNVAPWQGRSATISTNPICASVPATGNGRWLLDMATSTVAKGKANNAAFHGRESIPAWWGFLDPEGNPTTNTRAAIQGMGTPLGGYKGTGLAMLVEVLCAVLSGGPISTEHLDDRTGPTPVRTSHMFMAIDPKRFLPEGNFQDRMERLNTLVKSARPAQGYDEVLVAGEPEWRTEVQRRKDGIPVPAPLWDQLSATARSLRMEPPAGKVLKEE
jgi:LDH2 family malate/lactate/ureidoglycolate dehydrogenase